MSEESQSNSEVVIRRSSRPEAFCKTGVLRWIPFYTEHFWWLLLNANKEKEEGIFDKWIFRRESNRSEVVNPKRKKISPLINETPKLESDSEVVNLKRKTKSLLINETQEYDRFVIDEDYDIVIEK